MSFCKNGCSKSTGFYSGFFWPVVRFLGKVEYNTTWKAMRRFTDHRVSDTLDEIWFAEHEPVYTLGQVGKPEHIVAPGDIPIIRTDRGGQVTYHGPGQLIVYFLLDLKRLNLSPRRLITLLEHTVIVMLADYKIMGETKLDAPGVYVGRKKIASIGLRIRRGYSYHGLAMNIGMDLGPFSGIHPCGFSDLAMIQLKDLGGPSDLLSVACAYLKHWVRTLNLNKVDSMDLKSWVGERAVAFTELS